MPEKLNLMSYPGDLEFAGEIFSGIFIGLEQLVHFPTREKNTLDLILTSLPGQFQEIHSPDKLSDHDVVSGTSRTEQLYVLSHDRS